MRRVALTLLWLACATHFVSCAPQQDSLLPSPGAAVALIPTVATLPTPTLAASAPTAPSVTATPVNPDSGWSTLQPGLEQRVLNLTGPDGDWLESLLILRLQPQLFHFDVAYSPGEPQSLTSWQAQSGALLVVNGGFFTEENLATGLLISGGQRHGVSYEAFGGMFAVTADGPSLRWLPQQPYNPDEALQAALQAFPMLLTPGGVPGPSSDDGQRARRTVVAQDNSGRILFLLAMRGHFTLYELSRYLQQSDLDLDMALNLDGGASTGLILADPPLFVPPLSLLPAVITVYVKE